MSSSARPTETEAHPEPRPGIALCLSGGGFRALLFHLGALRRLNELGVLAKVDTISSASGGSILAARLATLIADDPEMTVRFTPEGWDGLIETPLRDLTRSDLAAGIRSRRLLPWNWLRPGAAVEALAERYADRLTPIKLRQLPESPRFVFCATDRLWGVPWTYERDRIGDRQVGWAAPPEDVSLARAVAASSCFPHAVDPLPARLDPSLLTGGAAPAGRERDASIRRLTLVDGASHAHLGLEPVWTTHSTVLVSEGGALPRPRRRPRFLRRKSAVPEIDTEGQSLRKRRLVSGYAAGTIHGTFWSISAAPSSYGVGFGYSKELARDVLCSMRTGLDPVDDAEAAILRNHGYLTADAALRQHTPGLLPRIVPPLAVPFPAWSPADPRIEVRVREAMSGSWRRRRR